MIVTALSDIAPGAGTRMQWTLTPTASEPSDGPLTFLQENHVRSLQKAVDAGEPHRAFIGCAMQFTNPLDIDAMSRAITTFIGRHEGLRTHFQVGDNAEVSRFVTPQIQIQAQECGKHSDTDDFSAYLIDHLSRDAHALSAPGYAFGAVAQENGFFFYFGVDHALSDGVSDALAVSELIALYEAELAATPADLPPAGSFLDYARDESDLAVTHLAPSPQVQRWIEIFDDNGATMPRCPLDLGLAEGERARVAPIKYELLDADETAAFDAACKSGGGRFIGGLYAALALAEHTLTDEGTYYGMGVFSTRSEAYLGSQGWMCGFAPVAFPFENRTFSELVGPAQASVVEARELVAAPIPAVLGTLLARGHGLDKLSATPNLVSYIDYRWFPGIGTPIVDNSIQFTGEGATANASMWFSRHHHSVTVGMQAPDTPVALANVHTLLDRLRTAMRTIAATGDCRADDLTSEASDAPTTDTPTIKEPALAGHDD